MDTSHAARPSFLTAYHWCHCRTAGSFALNVDDKDNDIDDDYTHQSEQLTLGGEDYSGDYLDYLLNY